MKTTEEVTRLKVSRHLQDFNGYCGPACALMVVEFTGSAKSPPVFAQNEFFREIRNHAKQAKDRRPVKSPAESLLSMLNDHTAGEQEWVKTFNSNPQPVASEIIHAVEEKNQPCLMLVSRGMHWVVAFGVQRKLDGTPAGLIMRDPAWSGMPKFYGLSIFPETPAIEHTQSPCACLENTKKPPSCVHERYITMHELISGRGLQGSPDWEGKGAIAIVPEKSESAPLLDLGISPAAGEVIINPREQAGAAAIAAVKENGLYGRPDSPEVWNKALNGATAGEPILVKDPKNSEDDFYLVPLNPADPSAKRGAWAMLDAKTLTLREVSLLENWQTPVFPSDSSEDAQKASEQQHTLPDGSKARFKKEDFKPNTNNLVWAASAACVLPYAPAKELIAPHPVTGEPVSIYVNQEGEVFSQLMPDNIDPPIESTSLEPPESETPPQPKTPAQTPALPSKLPKALNIVLGATSAVLLGSTVYLANPDDEEADKLRDQVAEVQAKDHDKSEKIEDLEDQLGDANKKIDSLLGDSSEKIKSLSDEIDDLKKDIRDKDKTIGEQKICIGRDRKDLLNKDSIIAEQKSIINKHANTINHQKVLLDKAKRDVEILTATHIKEKNALKNKINEWERKYKILSDEKTRLQKLYDPVFKRANVLDGMVGRLNKEVQQFKAANDAANRRYNDLSVRYQAHLKHHNHGPRIPDVKALNDRLAVLLKQWATLNAKIQRARKGTDTRIFQEQKRAIEKQMDDIRSQLRKLKR